MGFPRILVLALVTVATCLATQDAQAQLDVFPRSLDFAVTAGARVATDSAPLSISGRGTALAFTINTATDGGGSWFSVSPLSGNTPLT